ncbi:unnamed protein product [Fusarium graminearum]|uniref:Chromosome 1, complete genome n=1 Tax=Gibberella zeae (strain ATCC MYA-4620 / CBS 123657 / FGSC 9075 / NRRL 31084 / PH-1) TaxID=229533 RepID=A0A0E0RWT3_GIBZE|nr:hypothetical protein FG05_35228 [Fusarium graminearum]CEF75708.1 unnamed protein product [Fusarium graminearum]
MLWDGSFGHDDGTMSK